MQAHAGEGGGRREGKGRTPLAYDASTAQWRTIACACIRAQPLDYALTRQPLLLCPLPCTPFGSDNSAKHMLVALHLVRAHRRRSFGSPRSPCCRRSSRLHVAQVPPTAWCCAQPKEAAVPSCLCAVGELSDKRGQRGVCGIEEVERPVKIKAPGRRGGPQSSWIRSLGQGTQCQGAKGHSARVEELGWKLKDRISRVATPGSKVQGGPMAPSV